MEGGRWSGLVIARSAATRQSRGSGSGGPNWGRSGGFLGSYLYAETGCRFGFWASGQVVEIAASVREVDRRPAARMPAHPRFERSPTTAVAVLRSRAGLPRLAEEASAPRQERQSGIALSTYRWILIGTDLHPALRRLADGVLYVCSAREKLSAIDTAT